MTPVPTTPRISFLDFCACVISRSRFRASWCCWHRRWFEKHSRHPRAPSAGTRVDEYWLGHFLELQEAMAFARLVPEEPLEPDEEIKLKSKLKKKI